MIKKRCFKNFCPESFINAVRKIRWLDVYLCEDVDNACEMFTNRLTEILDKMAPIKTIQVRSNYLPWMSEATKNKIKMRNKKLKIAK